jgi:hypothetical protein
MVAELEELYRARRPDFCRAAAAIAGDRGLGEDAVQDAFAKAVRKRRTYRGRGPLEAWVWRIVVNPARDARRRRPRVANLRELRTLNRGADADGNAKTLPLELLTERVGCINSIFTPRLYIRGVVRRGGRAVGPEVCMGSLWAEDWFRWRDPAVGGQALGVDAAG